MDLPLKSKNPLFSSTSLLAFAPVTPIVLLMLVFMLFTLFDWFVVFMFMLILAALLLTAALLLVFYEEVDRIPAALAKLLDVEFINV